MKYFKKIFDFVYSRGISEKFEQENEMTGLINIMCLIDVLGAGGLFLWSFFYSGNVVYQYIIGIITLVYFNILLLNHFGKVHEARMYYSLIVPMCHAMVILLMGGYFGQSVVACTGLIITALNYDNRKPLRNLLILHGAFIFIGVTVYINFNGPIFEVEDQLFDELVAMFLCLAWIYSIFYIYENRNKEYIDSLQKKNQQLNEKTVELQRFATITSHDLKSPLQNISNFLNVMDTDIQKQEYTNLENYLGYAKSCAYRMRELIEGVLEVSTNNEDYVVNPKPEDLNEILKKVLETNQKELYKRNAIVTSDVLPIFNCNAADFTIVFQNFILNGIKYNTSDKPKIVINTKNLKNHFVLQFTDNGIGIDEKHHQEIFQYFKRLHNHSTYPGTGLGLGLCKKLVEKYHGTIEVDSIVGAYTSFKVILPKDWESIETQGQLEQGESPMQFSNI